MPYRQTVRACALNTSAEGSFLDHISPLASLLGVPLIVSDERNAMLVKKYYPEVALRYWPNLEFRLNELAQEFDTLIGCDYWHPARKGNFRKLIFCPHGQSDKGYKSPILAPYAVQEAVLLYGALMQEMLSELGLWPHIPQTALIGNFRLHYYRLYEQRLSQMAQEEVFSRLVPGQRTLLYAPTWRDDDEATTFFALGEKIASELPDEWNLIVKAHPLLAQRDPALFYRLALLEQKRPNLLLVDEFPPIYPLLEKIDAYLGDYSSIGYDLLAFQKPMFFLKQPHLPPARLHACGVVIDPNENIFCAVERQLPRAQQLRSIQAALYQKAFAPVTDIRKTLEAFV